MQRLTSIIALVVLAACGGNGGGGTGGGGGNDDPAACEQPPSQALSQACCTAHGIDACGASLFCAAFDGRKQPTCYAERSRADKEECTDDRQCMSGSCNTDEGACRSLPSTKCDPAIGCAADPAGNRYACVVETTTCLRVGDGSYRSVCELEADCAADTLTCRDGLCDPHEPVCGVFSGAGPCVDEPNGIECRECRVTAAYYGSGTSGGACEPSYQALEECRVQKDCFDEDGFIDFACLTVSCDAELCAAEGCAARAGDEHTVCY